MASLPIFVPQQQHAWDAPAAASMVGTVLPARLSALEWSIVAMAQQDSLSSIREPGRYMKAIRALFGLKTQNRLANDRLEALRRTAILAWHHGWNVPKSEFRAFLDAGFSADQFELIQNSLGQARAASRRRRRAQ